MAPGILYVTMQPKPGLSPDQFHEWYDNEHGPTRLRLPDIFPNGLRYRATDGQAPEFLAVYDVTSMHHLDTERYTTLREHRSAREAEIIGQVEVKRYFYDLLDKREAAGFVPVENLPGDEGLGRVTVAVEIETTAADAAEGEYIKWYTEEHVGMLSNVTGWLRSRLFRASEGEGRKTLLALHDYAPTNGLDGPEHKASMETPRRTSVFERSVASKGRRTYSLFYIFGPAARDLSSLSRLPPGSTGDFSSGDGLTVTVGGSSDASISSYISTSDSLSIPYRLEGSGDADAPTIAFSNSLLTSLHMWDPLVAIIKTARPDLRILRYDSRGRHSVPQPPHAASLDDVTADLVAVLDALRIPRLHALVGVSMGGAACLNFALKHPARLSRLVACDFNAASSPANTQAWKDRIAISREDSSAGLATKLAPITVDRWFHPDTTANKPDTVKWMVDMVSANDVEGFANSCTALWDYDLKPAMPTCDVPSLLVVGEGDGKGALAKVMDGFKALLGPNGAELRVVPNTGHLPMCEEPRVFWDAVASFIT
ncbi:Ndr family [Geosmithia morbida]|uniref:Ndr family n=1 Tax=Geosmithia morbida TaxID=1094350 RepID=A0A9P5D3D5_9HYPO|nr:Ndr family [Geosmithia morbida]KAF4121685.1 Ndr family [Geosmithia morbida]